jgi:hypothetical protein
MDEAGRRWAACGAMALTGDADGPPLLPATTAAADADALARPFGLDARLLAERAAHARLHRQGTTSCGGASRLWPATDGWVALTLARPEDEEVLPALLGVTSAVDIGPAIAQRTAGEVVEQATLLGVPCAAVGADDGAAITSQGSGRAGRRFQEFTVVDLSALWAGPLCGSLLGRVGGRVAKVETSQRPDGARRGPAAFFDALNGTKTSIVVDLATEHGRRRLAELVESADVVISSARARALDQLGLDPERQLAGGTDRVWVAITGHGWASNRVGFGDDAAAGAGLVAWHPADGRPRFAGDAIADPLCGLRAADAALAALRAGGRWFVDASLSGAARASVIDDGLRPAVAASGRGRLWRIGDEPVAEPATIPR